MYIHSEATLLGTPVELLINKYLISQGNSN